METADVPPDLLVGAESIAEYVFGDKGEKFRVYHNPGSLPVFRIGALLCARKATINQWLADREREALVKQAEKKRKAPERIPKARRRSSRKSASQAAE
jgi:hypothetical protein